MLIDFNDIFYKTKKINIFDSKTIFLYYLAKKYNYLYKATIFLLIIIFLINCFGFFILFKTAQYQAKEEAKKLFFQKINPEKLIILTFSDKDLHKIDWYESGKEFSYDNKMYDVVKMIYIAGQLKIYCINDKFEDELFENLNQYIYYNFYQNLSKSKIYKNIFKQILNDYFKSKSLKITTYFTKTDMQLFCMPEIIIGFKAILFHPPEKLF